MSTNVWEWIQSDNLELPQMVYNARRLMGSQIIESDTYCNQILLAQLYLKGAQKASVN